MVFTVAQGTRSEIIILSLIKTGGFFCLISEPSLQISALGRQREPKAERSGGSPLVLVQPLPGLSRRLENESERAVKSRNVCQGQALFRPAAAQAVTEQLPQREGSGGGFLMARSLGSEGFDGTGKGGERARL